MWRTGVVLLLSVIIIENCNAEVRHGDQKIVERFKRSPYYCHPHRHWPPPPPPYWPPPPEQSPGPPSWGYQQQHQAYTQPGENQNQPQKCETCNAGPKSSNAMSNAESDSGSAIAVAVAKAKAQR